MLGSACYIAYELNYFYLAYQKLILQQRGYGGLDNNGAAMILAMAIPLAFFAWEATRRWWRWAYMAAIPVLGHAVLLSYSRGAMLSLGVISLLMWWRARNKLFVTAAYALGLVLLVATTGKEIEERFMSIGTEGKANPRWDTWLIAVRMANDRPLFGFGIRVSPKFTYTQYGADIPDRAIHNTYLQTAADSGWPALALYLALIGSIFYGLWQTRRALRKFNDPESLQVRSLASGLECALAMFCFGATFLSLEHFEMPYIVMLLAVQLHAITRAVTARLNPSPSGLPPVTLPYPYPASQRPLAVSP
jgi:probable O-glycosylation ligase (exosortase A-associated)